MARFPAGWNTIALTGGQPQQVGQSPDQGWGRSASAHPPDSHHWLPTRRCEAALLGPSPQPRECSSASVDLEFVIVAEDQGPVVEGNRPAPRKSPVTPDRTGVGNDVAVIFDDHPRRAPGSPTSPEPHVRRVLTRTPTAIRRPRSEPPPAFVTPPIFPRRLLYSRVLRSGSVPTCRSVTVLPPAPNGDCCLGGGRDHGGAWTRY